LVVVEGDQQDNLEHILLVDQQVVLVPINLLILQQQQVDLVVEVITLFHHQLDGVALVEIIALEVLVLVAVELVVLE
tara:strand:+ start:145 stop:375 length:231 start_codon:yes stop_codon:yes gene_type:complete